MGEYSTRDNVKEILQEQKRKQLELKNKRQKQDNYVQPKQKINYVKKSKDEKRQKTRETYQANYQANKGGGCLRELGLIDIEVSDSLFI